MNERRDEMTSIRKNATDAAGEISFEEAFRRLETIVSTLETGRGELEDSLAKYEEGIRLLRRCRQILDGAQRRVEILKGFDENGAPILERADENALRSQTDVAGRQTPPARSSKNSIASTATNAVAAPSLLPNENGADGSLPASTSPPRRPVRRVPSNAASFLPIETEKTPTKRAEPTPKSRGFFDDEPPF